MQVCLVPPGNLICTYHIIYGGITEYVFKFPQHGTLFLLSETVLFLITSSKSRHFPARHYFAFHLISGEFLPMRSSRWKFNTWLSLILGPLPSNTQFYRHRGENQLPNEFEVPGAQVDPYQTLQEVARKN